MPSLFKRKSVQKEIVLEDIFSTELAKDLSIKSIMQALKDAVDALPAEHLERLKTLRPWAMFFDANRFSVPDMMEATKRFGVNVCYFTSNYLIVSLIIALYQIVTHPTLLLAMVGCAGFAAYFRSLSSSGYRFIFGGKRIKESQVYGFLSGMTVFLFWITGGTSAVFWTLTLCVATITAHATLRDSVDTETLVRKE
mmetsp:Transcript_5023/g.7499  ORF Transcript_5023/g.7499 Transcript_5023/m.7499 type:complete len:196 (-) Transcript_5023:33-620(-)